MLDCLQDEHFPLGQAAAADIAELIAATQDPGERVPSAVECSHMSAVLLADQYEVPCPVPLALIRFSTSMSSGINPGSIEPSCTELRS